MTDQDQSSPKSRSLITIILLAVGVTMSVVGLALWFADSGRDTPLVILKADTSPYKIEPENPGGLTINSQDSPVMSLLESQAEDKTGTEVLLPPESEPELPPIAVESTPENPISETPPQETPTQETPATSEITITEQEPAATTSSGEDNKTAEEPASEDKTAAEAEAPAATETATVEDKEEQPSSQPENTQESETKPVDIKPESTEPDITEQANTQPEITQPENIDDAVEAVLNTPPESLPKKRPRSDDGQPYFVVQFAAFKTEKSAKTTAALLTQKHAERLNGVELGHIKRGDYWRVVSDPMLRAEAAQLCNMFRSVGQDCITKLLEDTP